MGWIIENNEGLAWSNSEGFTEGDDYETFDEEERKTLALPISGHWVEVEWEKEFDPVIFKRVVIKTSKAEIEEGEQK